MLKIRMKRAGGKNHPFFRVVVMDSRRARDSRAVEVLGYYNPLEKPMVVNVDRERVAYWSERGAQLSDSVRTLLKRENSGHPTRRAPEAFEAAPPPEKPAGKGKKLKAQMKPERGDSAVAVAEGEAPTVVDDGSAPKNEERPPKPQPGVESKPEGEASGSEGA